MNESLRSLPDQLCATASVSVYSICCAWFGEMANEVSAWIKGLIDGVETRDVNRM